MSAVRDAPGVYITATSQLSVVSISVVMSTSSVATVGEVTSDFFSPYLWFRLSVIAQPFIYLHRFLFKNIRICSSLCLWIMVSCSPLIRWNTTLSCICCIYYYVALIPSFTNIFIPWFRFSCVNTWTMRFVYLLLWYMWSKLVCRHVHCPCLQESCHTCRSAGGGEFTWNSKPSSSCTVYLFSVLSYSDSFLLTVSTLGVWCDSLIDIMCFDPLLWFLYSHLLLLVCLTL